MLNVRAMKKQIILASIVTLILLTACKKEESQELDEKKKSFDKLEQANWFLGEWKNTTTEMDFTETWAKETDSSYRAQSFIVAAKDTVFFEHVLLEQANDSLFYRAYERKEKLSQAVSFYATKIGKNEIIFENPKHDFPNKIIYSKITPDSIVASIYGSKKMEVFSMKRKK